MVVLAELLLRGPQTLGELRGRASRMHPIESLEMAKNILQQLMGKPQPLVKQIAPAVGSRAERYVQLLCPELHEIDEAAQGAAAQESQRGPAGGGGAMTVGERVARLEGEVAMLREALARLAAEIGASDPFAPRESEARSEPSSSSSSGGQAS
jgi:uncharacterized protein YceH (UPF0502 family)